MKRKGFKKKKGINPFIIVIASFLVIIYAFIFVDQQVRPTIQALSEVEARIIGAQGINNGVSKALKYGVDYNNLIKVMKDDQGNITLMQADTIAINILAAKIISSIQEEMEAVETKILKIPMGNVVGSQLLANHGPKLEIEIIPIGSVEADFYTEFEQAGINQTIHRIYIAINTKVQVIVPLSSDVVEITSNVPIAETVIVGEVPNFYMNTAE